MKKNLEHRAQLKSVRLSVLGASIQVIPTLEHIRQHKAKVFARANFVDRFGHLFDLFLEFSDGVSKLLFFHSRHGEEENTNGGEHTHTCTSAQQASTNKCCIHTQHTNDPQETKLKIKCGGGCSREKREEIKTSN